MKWAGLQSIWTRNDLIRKKRGKRDGSSSSIRVACWRRGARTRNRKINLSFIFQWDQYWPTRVVEELTFPDQRFHVNNDLDEFSSIEDVLRRIRFNLLHLFSSIGKRQINELRNSSLKSRDKTNLRLRFLFLCASLFDQSFLCDPLWRIRLLSLPLSLSCSCSCSCSSFFSLHCAALRCCRTVIIWEVDVLLANSCFHLD